ncbi:hypothetical protein [Haematobacter massiliensis]|uniref:hypothetical protein n=1 Tax=Haematobacter massiliensis TaxID=195105 RepID=UPI001594E766|nr:hypothetical protein [Haematobacter massiliensis]
MIGILLAARTVVTALIFAFAGIAFFPAEAAAKLTSLQKFLGKEIERRRARVSE